MRRQFTEQLPGLSLINMLRREIIKHSFHLLLLVQRHWKQTTEKHTDQGLASLSSHAYLRPHNYKFRVKVWRGPQPPSLNARNVLVAAAWVRCQSSTGLCAFYAHGRLGLGPQTAALSDLDVGCVCPDTRAVRKALACALKSQGTQIPPSLETCSLDCCWNLFLWSMLHYRAFCRSRPCYFVC